jgi:hypothetical protein
MAEPETDEAADVGTDTESIDESEVEDALNMLFTGRVDEVIPPEEAGEFHDFIREEALRRRRFAVSFRVECGCLAWIGYALSSVVTHEDGIEFKANPTQTYVPDHEPDVEHPEGPTEEPPDEFAEWPIWPFEIYQDELEPDESEVDKLDDAETALDDKIEELADELGLGESSDLAELTEVASQEDPLATDAIDE